MVRGGWFGKICRKGVLEGICLEGEEEWGMCGGREEVGEVVVWWVLVSSVDDFIWFWVGKGMGSFCEKFSRVVWFELGFKMIIYFFGLRVNCSGVG